MVAGRMVMALGLLGMLHADPAPGSRKTEEVDAGLPPTPTPFGEGMTRPVLQSGSPPLTYSEEWVERGGNGSLIVRCAITREGRIRDCTIVSPVEYMTEQTLRWLAEARFTPVTRNGEPQQVWYVFRFVFAHGRPPERAGGW
jgi:hypothetical protein